MGTCFNTLIKKKKKKQQGKMINKMVSYSYVQLIPIFFINWSALAELNLWNTTSSVKFTLTQKNSKENIYLVWRLWLPSCQRNKTIVGPDENRNIPNQTSVNHRYLPNVHLSWCPLPKPLVYDLCLTLGAVTSCFFFFFFRCDHIWTRD